VDERRACQRSAYSYLAFHSTSLAVVRCSDCASKRTACRWRGEGRKEDWTAIICRLPRQPLCRNSSPRGGKGTESGLASPSSGHKEGFFSHLRKRARRLSGRYQTPMSPNSDDIEANAGCSPWASSNRGAMVIDQPPLAAAPSTNSDYSDLDKALSQVRCSLEGPPQPNYTSKNSRIASNPMLKRHHSLPHGSDARPSENAAQPGGPISSRTRRALQNKSNPSNRYETPNEEEELLNEALTSATTAVKKLDGNAQCDAQYQKKLNRQPQLANGPAASYLTPSPSANRNGVHFGHTSMITPTKPLEISKTRTTKDEGPSKWPTPPYDENDWASSVSASLMATQSMCR
jgi:meiosis induction protein kinase IME2/SME1